ncbi:hypothetical protein T147_24675 [Salmonella enterica subsp. enterica serovar Muenchen]|nr:hypothetical protein [Salmonella enterica subsp. enterica serovar Muenchen]
MRTFFYVHYVLIYQTVTSLAYVFVPLAFRPLCDMKSYKSLFSDLRELPVSPGKPRILNKVAGLTT